MLKVIEKYNYVLKFSYNIVLYYIKIDLFIYIKDYCLINVRRISRKSPCFKTNN